MFASKSQPLHSAASGLWKKLRCLQSVKPNLRALSKKRSRPVSWRSVKTMCRKAWRRLCTLPGIGPLQSNKSRLVAENFDWCHTVDRLKIAQRLNEQRPENRPPLQVLIQVNISDEAGKSGIALSDVDALADQISQMPRLTLRGLMAIPAVEHDYERQLAVFIQMRSAFDTLRARYPQLDTLSMGMTDDMPAAIAAGSTMVRIGTAIFGARNYA